MAGVQPRPDPTGSDHGHLADEKKASNPVEELRGAVRHAAWVLVPGDKDYEAARCKFANHDYKPEVIVKAQNTADVAFAVKFATAQGKTLSVRAGSHSPSSVSAKGQVMIDVSGMKGVRVNRKENTVWVQAGCDLRDIDVEVAAAGLAILSGTAFPTGAGLFLHGGWSWYGRSRGLACDSIVEYEMVKADGSVHVVNKEEDPELFWACQGAASSFGVVTSWTMTTFVPPPAVSGMFFVPIEAVAGVLAALEKALEADNDLVASGILGMSPPPMGPPRLIGQFFAYVVGGMDKANTLKATLEQACGDVKPLMSMWAETSYLDQQKHNDALFSVMPKVYRPYWSSRALKPHAFQDPKLVQALADFWGSIEFLKEDPVQFLAVEFWGGKIKEHKGPVELYRQMDALIGFFGGVSDPSRDKILREACERFKTTVAPWLQDMTYPNYGGGDDEDGQAAAQCYASSADRLRALKKKHDPNNVFRYTPLGVSKLNI